ncbi:hypothetical protein HYX12_01620 [Candidatus Woesearchaeota archaeon]|nr:hypothetical protein [Candidatus Woesearchaeota archaeon]
MRYAHPRERIRTRELREEIGSSDVSSKQAPFTMYDRVAVSYNTGEDLNVTSRRKRSIELEEEPKDLVDLFDSE